MVVAAPAADVWALWSTTQGLSSWAAPLAAIDLRIGGVWEASYRPGARLGDAENIRNRVLAYLPGRMLTIQVAGAPPGFPHADLAARLWTVIELEPVDATQTRVRVSMTGYGSGAGYDTLYGHFNQGNAATLKLLTRRVDEGPVDWRRLSAPTAQAGAIREEEKKP
jgi:uncharacterized protein YndB with AHSA1/START domain